MVPPTDIQIGVLGGRPIPRAPAEFIMGVVAPDSWGVISRKSRAAAGLLMVDGGSRLPGGQFAQIAGRGYIFIYCSPGLRKNTDARGTRAVCVHDFQGG